MDMRSDAAGDEQESFALANLYDWLVSTSLADRADIVVALRNAVFAQTAPIVVGMLGTMMTAATAFVATHHRWPLLWCTLEALLVLRRLRNLHGAARRPDLPRRRVHFRLMGLGLTWASVNGLGTAACILTGIPALLVMGGINVAAVIGATATRNASTPRYAAIAIAFTGLPSVLACAFGANVDGIAALYLLVMMVGAFSVMRQNHRNMVRLFSAESAAARSARTDPLTGLGNRAHLSERMAALGLAPLGHAERSIGVLCLDLDGFKAVNDLHGHPAGDELLVCVAERLCALVRDTDVLARTGGDEFVVLTLDATEETSAHLALRIIDTIGAPFQLQGAGVAVRIGVSVGGALQLPTGPREDLLVLADRALYAAKEAGRGVYRSSMGSAVSAKSPTWPGTRRSQAERPVGMLAGLDVTH